MFVQEKLNQLHLSKSELVSMMQTQEIGSAQVFAASSAKGLRTPAACSATWKSASSTPRCSVPKFLMPSREQIFFGAKPVLVFRETKVQIRLNELISKKRLLYVCLLCVSLLFVVQLLP